MRPCRRRRRGHPLRDGGPRSLRIVAALVALLGWQRTARSEPAVDAATPPPGPLVIEGPGSLTLGQGGTVVLHYRAPAGLQVRAVTNTGSLSAPQPRAGANGAKDGGGRWMEMTYAPPAERFPQVAIIALTGPQGRVWGVHRIALHGQARVEVRTEPRTPVTVMVADRTFGPVQSDARGRAQVPVVVPPGVAHAVSVAVDAAGNRQTQRIPLGAPPFGRVLAVCPGAGQRFLVFTSAADGTTGSTDDLVLGGERIAPRSPKVLAKGAYSVRFDVPAGVRAGEQATVLASLSGEDLSRSRCTLPVPQEPPVSLELSSAAERYDADGDGAAVPLVARFTYTGGRAPQRLPIQFATDLGRIDPPQVQADGSVATRLWLPRDFEGRSHATVTASANAMDPLTAEVRIALRPGRLSRLALQAQQTHLHADGQSATELRVDAFDAHGNPLSTQAERAALLARALRLGAAGKLGPLRFEGAALRARYVAPDRYDPGGDTVRVVDGTGTAQAELRIRLLPPGQRFRLQLRAGYLDNLAKVGGPLAMLGATYRMPFGRERWHVGLEVGALYSTRMDDLDAGGQVQTQETALPVLLRTTYAFPLARGALYPVLCAGLVTAQVRAEAEGQAVSEVSGAWAAWGFGAGVEWPLGPGHAQVELGYLRAYVSDPRVHGNVLGYHASAGYAWAL